MVLGASYLKGTTNVVVSFLDTSQHKWECHPQQACTVTCHCLTTRSICHLAGSMFFVGIMSQLSSSPRLYGSGYLRKGSICLLSSLSIFLSRSWVWLTLVAWYMYRYFTDNASRVNYHFPRTCRARLYGRRRTDRTNHTQTSSCQLTHFSEYVPRGNMNAMAVTCERCSPNPPTC